MAVIVNKEDDENMELSARIGADLREKMAATDRSMGNTEDPDMVEDADYVKDLQKTGRFAWVWMVLVAIAVVAIIVVSLSNF